MIVLKFGGTSVANATNISATMDIISEAASRDKVIVVSSAISGCTDALLEIGRLFSEGKDGCEQIERLKGKHFSIIKRLFSGEERNLAEQECDSLFKEIESRPAVIEAYGELLSTKIIARKFICEGCKAVWIDSRKLIVKTDLNESYRRISEEIEGHPDVRVFIAPGFIASTFSGEVTTLGRGGSDFSAAIYAAATKAADLQIWTDVPGIMTTNPKTVRAARTIPRMSYQAAFCMAEHGAKVLYAPTVIPAREAGIDINIRNTFDPKNPGTIIGKEEDIEVCSWVGLSSTSQDENVKLYLTAEGPIDKEASEKRMVDCLKNAGIAALGTGDGDGFVWSLVRSNVEKQACSALHREFFEESVINTYDVYVAGYGSVGHALEKLIKSGIAMRSAKEVRIVEISSDHDFADRVLESAPRRSIFVDCTNSEDIWEKYVPMLEKGISVVSSNRRSLSVPYVDYAAMKQAALRNGVFFRYSTTVGNALPVLESVAMGEDIESVEAVVSCTLNHIITGYDGANTESFATLLMHAQDAGLTELDPRTDLRGKDALRKLLILAREAGVALEESDVEITPMLPEDYFNCSLEEFYGKLQAAEPEFIKREAELDAMDKRQRFVASITRDPSAKGGFRAEIKMRLYPISSPFYWISGTQNIIEIKSRGTAPLVIKGAGEGAQQAAAGILKDILR